MALIEEAKGLLFFCEQEQKIGESSRSQWAAEFKLFSNLADLYIRLNTLSKISSTDILVPAELFLTTQSLMYGAVSQILRRRIQDAESATRRAIEATATAYRLFRHSDLLQIYAEAYSTSPRSEGGDWKPSRNYKNEFSTAKLFSEPPGFWDILKADYAMFSVMSSHAGLGATAQHITIESKRTLLFFESDDKNVYRCWYHQLGIYWTLLRVFIHILRGTADSGYISMLEGEMREWQARSMDILKQRAPWIATSTAERFSGALGDHPL